MMVKNPDKKDNSPSWAWYTLGIFVIFISIIGMFSSFVSFFIIFIGGLFLLPFIHKLIEKKLDKSFSEKIKFIIFGIFIFFAIIFSGFGEGDNSSTNENQILLTTEQQIQQDVQKILGSDKIKDLTYYGDTGQIIINYKASDYSSERTLQYDHIKIYEKLFENYNVEEVSIFSWMIFVDTYGQEKEMIGVRSMMTKETADKINWDNLITDNLSKVANTYYVQPALKD